MRTRLSAFLTVAALACLTSVAGAQAKPATVTCNDGTTSTATGRGACSSHGGVKKADTTKGGAKSTTTTAAKPATTTPPKPPKPADTTKGKSAGKGTTKTAMVKCTDGTMSKGGQGACSSHGGIAKPK
jgi:hypothetical protein